MNLRLLPSLAVAASALLALKLLGLVLGTGLPGVAPLQTAEAQETAAPAGDAGGAGGTPPPTDGAPADPAPAGDAASDGPPPPIPDSLEIGGSAAERAVLESLGQRRDNLQKQEDQLDLREKLLQATEDRIQKRVDELKALEQSIEGKVEEKRKQEEGEIAALVTMYENMKPKDAARIFDRLSMEVLLKVVRQMKPRKMADILGKMSPEAAERLTVAIANSAGGGGMAPQMSGELPKIQPN
ncbi:MotE family protein [Roseibium aestuarii]|uniref:MotE family protein n=1 Tax=Roseibium aestuarii TaxID=2600299 RepID=A0ABW4JZH5_9HYPH|nr:flagellar protein FlbB [Roseibium aestuarii]